MWRFAIALVLLCGCSGPRARLDNLFEAARNDMRRGNLAKAQVAAERGMEAAAGGGDHVSALKFRLLRCEILLARGGAEGALKQLRGPVPESREFAPLRARQKTLEGQALLALGRFDEAGGILNEAHQLAQTVGTEELLVEVEGLQGARLIRLRQWAEAEHTLQTALGRARAQRSNYLEAGISVNLGMNRVRQHRFDEAAGWFERASALAGPETRRLYSAAQANLASCYYRLGEFDRAIAIQLRAIAEHEKSGARPYLQQALGETGNTYLLKGEPKNAIAHLQRALDIARDLRANGDAAIWAGNLSVAFSELAEWDSALRLNAEAKRLKAGANSRTMVYNTLNEAYIDLGRGDHAKATRLFREAIAEGKDDPGVLWDAHAGLGAVAAAQGRQDQAPPHFEDAIAVVERTRSDLLRTEFKLPFLTRLIRLYRQYVDVLIEQGKTERALAVADSSRAQVLAEGSSKLPASRTPPALFKRASSGSRSVLLSYWLAPSRSYVWVITPDRIRCLKLPPATEIEPLVARYRAAIEQQLANPVANRIAEGERLFQVLVQPVLKWVAPGSRVLIVPDGVLHGLNFEMLPVPGGAPHYWIEDVTVAVAPSLSLLARPATPERRPRGLLLLGDPLTEDPVFPPLAQAAREIDSVSAHFAAPERTVLRREGATPDAYGRAVPGRFAAIHFTAHATANRESPLDSAVLLSGGKLYARDVMEMPLNADLVTFSACRGVGLRAYSGEGLVGFAWAFLRAGARNVIAGLWDVNDQSTAALMDLLYRELATGKPPADALRMAKLSLIHSGTNFRKPYYWAPFQIYTITPAYPR